MILPKYFNALESTVSLTLEAFCMLDELSVSHPGKIFVSKNDGVAVTNDGIPITLVPRDGLYILIGIGTKGGLVMKFYGAKTTLVEPVAPNPAQQDKPLPLAVNDFNIEVQRGNHVHEVAVRSAADATLNIGNHM